MQKKIQFLFFMMVAAVAGLGAQSVAQGSTIGGSTGLVVTPSARVAWEKQNFGFDVGYSFLLQNANTMSHVPFFNISFLKRAEVGMSFDLVDRGAGNVLNHMTVNGKVRVFESGASALAIGGNYQAYNNYDNNYSHYGQIYTAFTYGGSFFGWPATTSMALGYTLVPNAWSSNIDFGMGFELTLLPQHLKDYVHWVLDFGNFSYRYRNPTAADAGSRGVFNTGLRIDVLKQRQWRLVFDIVGTDLLDDGRGFMICGQFGYAPKI